MNLGYPAFVMALVIGLVGGTVSLCLGRRLVSHLTGACTAVIACLAALVTGVQGVVGSAWHLNGVWPVPMGAFNLCMDPLSGFFVAIIAGIGLLAAVYGYGYLKPYVTHRHLGLVWFWFNGLLASMWLVVTASNAVLFLVAWEGMSLTSFFLVIFEHKRREVLTAGWIYLVATHLGTACLLFMFVFMSGSGGSLDFVDLTVTNTGRAAVVFFLALIGFGTKAGLMPMHVWLPLAHPAAPSHVSAVMSGVMIKTGIYGLLRILTLLGVPAIGWGWCLIAVGVISGVCGVLSAMVQHDLKRLLAYHSVENIGIMCLGLGLGLVGISTGTPTVAYLGLAGGLLHVMNHAIFKSLLFMGAGSVYHATGTLEIDRLGGLLKRMPITGITFLIGAAAIAGLPPLNGFVSEFLLYLGALRVLMISGGGHVAWSGVLVMGSLALIGGLATACFAKAFTVIFLGESRSDFTAVHECPRSMTAALVTLTLACVAIGLLAPLSLMAIRPVVGTLMIHLPATVPGNHDVVPGRILLSVSLTGAGLLGVVTLLALIRRRLLARRIIRQAPTWDCGYLIPNRRMQYTASSFVWPLVEWFNHYFKPLRSGSDPIGLFPTHASLHTHIQDRCLEEGYRPLFGLVAHLADRLRLIQQGRNQLYVLYLGITILVLLVWKMR